MRLNAKDLYATALVAAIIALYVAYLQDSSGWVVSSTRATAAVVAVLGIGACALGRAEGLYKPDRSLPTAVYATWAAMLGSLAVVAIGVVLVSADPAALRTLVVLTVGLWATATVRHLLTAPAAPAPAPHRPGALDQAPRRAVRH